jgi:hypothetical protein
VKAHGVKRVSGGEVNLLKRFGFESQIAKFVLREAPRQSQGTGREGLDGEGGLLRFSVVLV